MCVSASGVGLRVCVWREREGVYVIDLTSGEKESVLTAFSLLHRKQEASVSVPPRESEERQTDDSEDSTGGMRAGVCV